METIIELTTKKILDIPRINLSANNISQILHKDYDRMKDKIKEKVMLLLLDCHNKKLSLTDAIVIINNWENGKDI